MSRPVIDSPASTPVDTSSVGGNPVSSIAAALRGGGSTSGHPVLPPRSPRQSLGVGDGVDTPPPFGVSPTDGGAGCPQTSGSAIPFDHLAAIGLSPEEAVDNCYSLTAAQAADLRDVLRGWR